MLRLFTYFLVAGVAGGSVATAVLWRLLEPKPTSSNFGIADTDAFLLFPLVGGLLAGTFAVILKSDDFGLLRGALAALCSFITFNALFTFFGKDYFSVFLASTVIGFMLFGWFFVLVGAVTGWLYKRGAGKAF